MKPFTFSKRSEKALQGVNPKLVAVVRRALELTPIDFVVTEGLRTEARQRELVRTGASKTMKSKHLTGLAVDLAPYAGGKVRWDWALFIPLATAMQAAAEELRTPVRWGGTWALLNEGPPPSLGALHKRFPDGPHFELLD